MADIFASLLQLGASCIVSVAFERRLMDLIHKYSLGPKSKAMGSLAISHPINDSSVKQQTQSSENIINITYKINVSAIYQCLAAKSPGL